MAFNVKIKNAIINITNASSKADVWGRLSRLKSGPIMVKIRPKVDEIKNLGNLSIFSQKLGMLVTTYYII